LITRNWTSDLQKFQEFLAKIPLNKYSGLSQIKTVEQDLPKELLPLELYYKYYWESTDFKSFDDIFEEYWMSKITHICKFIKKYFYGCSLQFVEEGFKARLYRIWMSILTQFHFQYLWNATFTEKLESSAKLDAMGIDAIVNLYIKNITKKVAFQIKKISYRREASERRFTSRQQKYADIIVEVPYLVIDEQELANKLNNPHVRQITKNEYSRMLTFFKQNFTRYPNGFVVFNESYLSNIYNLIYTKLKNDQTIKRIEYKEIQKL
jgi:hypothetical protein